MKQSKKKGNKSWLILDCSLLWICWIVSNSDEINRRRQIFQFHLIHCIVLGLTHSILTSPLISQLSPAISQPTMKTGNADRGTFLSHFLLSTNNTFCHFIHASICSLKLFRELKAIIRYEIASVSISQQYKSVENSFELNSHNSHRWFMWCLGAVFKTFALLKSLRTKILDEKN